MPRFHFHFSDGFSDPDQEGHQFADLAAVRDAAVQFIGQSLCDRRAEFWADGEWLLSVKDKDGLIQFTIRVIATEAPAIHVIPAPLPSPGA
jgi:hypothetical protein